MKRKNPLNPFIFLNFYSKHYQISLHRLLIYMNYKAIKHKNNNIPDIIEI